MNQFEHEPGNISHKNKLINPVGQISDEVIKTGVMADQKANVDTNKSQRKHVYKNTSSHQHAVIPGSPDQSTAAESISFYSQNMEKHDEKEDEGVHVNDFIVQIIKDTKDTSFKKHIKVLDFTNL